jgi:mRNA interferase MazF
MLLLRRGEIYMVEFHAIAGSEIEGWHPALIIQNDSGNRASPVTIVAAITSKMGGVHLPTNVLVQPVDSGLRRPSLIQCGHLYTIDKSRIDNRIGLLSDALLKLVDQALTISLGLVPMPPPRRPAR